MIRAHLLRWRPRPHAQRTASTPRVRSSGAASQLDPSPRSSRVYADRLMGTWPARSGAVKMLGRGAVTLEERGHALRVGAAPAALRRDAEGRRHGPRRADARE